MTWADTTAVVNKVKTVAALATATWVALAPKPTAPDTALALPYCIVHPDDGRPEQQRFTGPPVVEHPEYTLHVAGASANSVQVVVDLIKAQFVVDGFVIPPAVAGRRSRDGYWRMPTPIQTDRDVTPWLVFAVIELGWTSEPA